MRKRNRTIAIRCTEEEYQRIHNKAEQYGLRLNDFVIRSALGQIATLANMDRLTIVNFQPLLDEHIKATETIGQLLREVK